MILFDNFLRFSVPRVLLSLAGIDADAWTLQALLANLDENKQGPKR